MDLINYNITNIGKNGDYNTSFIINKCQDKTLKIVAGVIVSAGYFIYIGAFILAILLVWL